MEEKIDVGAWKKFQARLHKMWTGVDDEVVKVIEDESSFLLQQIKQNIRSAGLIETGEYLASWNVEEHGKFERIVRTAHPAAHRLEYGFVGTDALGRHYANPPRPHVRPAEQATMTKFAKDLQDGVRRLWQS